jgi:hypothetical protein
MKQRGLIVALDKHDWLQKLHNSLELKINSKPPTSQQPEKSRK